MRIPVAALCVAVAFATSTFAQTSKPPRAPEASRSICAGLMPKSQGVARENDPFAGKSRREIERRLLREGPRPARELDLEALMGCLTAELGSRG